MEGRKVGTHCRVHAKKVMLDVLLKRRTQKGCNTGSNSEHIEESFVHASRDHVGIVSHGVETARKKQCRATQYKERASWGVNHEVPASYSKPCKIGDVFLVDCGVETDSRSSSLHGSQQDDGVVEATAVTGRETVSLPSVPPRTKIEMIISAESENDPTVPKQDQGNKKQKPRERHWRDTLYPGFDGVCCSQSGVDLGLSSANIVFG